MVIDVKFKIVSQSEDIHFVDTKTYSTIFTIARVSFDEMCFVQSKKL